MSLREYAVSVKLSFELNKFWDNNDPNLASIEAAHQNAFLSFAQDVFLLDNPTLAENIFWHGVDFCHTDAVIWFHFFCIAENKDVAETRTDIYAKRAAKRMEEFGAHLKQIKLKT